MVYAVGNQFYIVVDDDDGVVYDHSERHDEAGESDRVKLDSKSVEQTKRDEDGDRDGGSGDERHV